MLLCTNLKKIGKVFTSKFVGTGPSSYKKRIYWAVVTQMLRNTALKHAFIVCCYLRHATIRQHTAGREEVS